MQNIIKSASKIVFILSENNFMILAGAAFTFYFSNKGDSSEPYAGK